MGEAFSPLGMNLLVFVKGDARAAAHKVRGE